MGKVEQGDVVKLNAMFTALDADAVGKVDVGVLVARADPARERLEKRPPRAHARRRRPDDGGASSACPGPRLRSPGARSAVLRTLPQGRATSLQALLSRANSSDAHPDSPPACSDSSSADHLEPGEPYPEPEPSP